MTDDTPSAPPASIATGSGIGRVLRAARFDRQEASGALGDLGTFLPLVLGMAQQNGLDFGVALFFAGVLNLLTGCLFAIPMAVQPMKAIAAVAITQHLTVPQILAAGMIVSAIVLVLGALGWIERLATWIPDAVVRGLQLAVGLGLCLKGLEWVTGAGMDRWFLALPAGLLGWWLMGSKRWPVALLLVASGMAIALWRQPSAFGSLQLGLHLPHFQSMTVNDFRSALTTAALPQVPLTLLNSVVAVCALSRDLFPGQPLTERKVAVSVGLMNLLTGWFGGMPMCHGAGGLAGQHAFGARTNGSILMLGAAKLFLAVLFGTSLMALAVAFPKALLGVLLAFSGLSLAKVVERSEDVPVALLTAAGCMGIGYLPGVLIGWAASRVRPKA
jgi:MFS superfamily sulfate permease-like transporter